MILITQQRHIQFINFTERGRSIVMLDEHFFFALIAADITKRLFREGPFSYERPHTPRGNNGE
jgi:hypothetical protein